MNRLQTMTSPQASAEADEVAAICDKHGPCTAMVMPGLFGGKPFTVKRCPACTEEREAKRQADEAAENQRRHNDRLRSLFGGAAIPARFQSRTLAGYVAETQGQKRALAIANRFVENWPEQSKQGTSLILTGGPGTGKTHIACGIASALIEQYYAGAVFMSTLEALRTIKATYNRDSPISEQAAIDRLLEPDLLILDEIGVQIGSEHEKLLLFDVLNGRYQQCRPTILISNLSGSDLEAYLGQRVMDRYRECGAVLAFDWNSYRGTR